MLYVNNFLFQDIATGNNVLYPGPAQAESNHNDISDDVVNLATSPPTSSVAGWPDDGSKNTEPSELDIQSGIAAPWKVLHRTETQRKGLVDELPEGPSVSEDNTTFEHPDPATDSFRIKIRLRRSLKTAANKFGLVRFYH